MKVEKRKIISFEDFEPMDVNEGVPQTVKDLRDHLNSLGEVYDDLTLLISHEDGSMRKLHSDYISYLDENEESTEHVQSLVFYSLGK